jgi:branched-chain amino acid transport system permease protein
MNFVLEIAPAIILFTVVTVAALPAIGQGRMLVLGTAAFYTAGAFLSTLGVNAPSTTTLAIGGLGGGIAGALMALLCVRLRGDYFALATLCFAELFRLVLVINPPFPGPQGIPAIHRGTLLGFSINSATTMTMASLALLFAVTAVTALIGSSPWGAALRAVNDHEQSARSAGLRTSRVRSAALVYAGVAAGLAGALGARYLSLADAQTFALPESVMVLVVVLLSRGSVWWCVLVAATLSALSEVLRFIATGAVRQMVFGALLVWIALVLRDDLREAEGAPIVL